MNTQARIAGRIASVAVAATVTVAVLAGCSSSGSGSSSGGRSAATAGAGGTASTSLHGTITVFAAASLTGTFTQLGHQFEHAHPGTTVRFDFGSSGDLATQITQGAPADVFASAAPKNMQQVVAAGYATSSSNFVKNTAEIAAAAGNPAHVGSVADLGKPGVKVALCVLTAPCGVVAEQVFANAKVKVTPTTRQPDVKSTLAVVETGEVDAGVVYVTDVMAAGSKVVGVPIPADQNATTDYPIATLTHSKNGDLATAFVDYVKSPDGLKVLTAAGFLNP
jgi:molybdate transport system substrate-binding protein